MLSIFELVKSVLDDEYESISPDGDRDATIQAEFGRLSDSYKDLETPVRPPPDYSNPETRFAYIYKYTTCHANIVAEKIAATPPLRKLFEKDWINVAALGGGPGSDFLGVLKHMLDYRAKGGLKCYMLDREAGWGDTWSDVEHRTQDLPFRVSTHTQALDVTDRASWTKQSRYLDADLFTFIYFLSEVYRLKEQADEFFAHLMRRAKQGALFLFVDNDRPSFVGWFDDLAQRHGLQLVGTRSQKFQLPRDEDISALEPYWSKFRRHYPRLKADMALRVYQKP